MDAGEHQDEELAPEDEFPVRRFEAWRKRSAIGGIATGIALGLQEVFYPTDNEPVITAEAPGDPPDDGERMRVVLDPDDPTKSVVIFPPRPTSD
ncbi:MAG TPA: hypothetical protein VHV57_14430 [Acidimicrobiales bacterium]|nr:hypothetical protein [Acidimicrobiales bacterium]